MDQNTTNPNPAPAPTPTPVVAQPTPAETPVVAQTPKAGKPKGKSKIGLIIGIIVAVLAVVGIVILILNLGGGIGFVKNPIYETNAYFIKDKDDKYILFNKNGERISEEKFDDVDDFYNGMALVEKDGKDGIIKDDGTMAIDFDEHEDGIYAVGAGIYSVSVEAGEDGIIRQLINGQGKVITETESAFLSTSFIGSYDVPFVAVVGEEDGQYDIYSAYGQRVFSIESKTEPVFNLVRQVNTKEDEYKYFASIAYDKGFAVYDANKLTEIVRLEDGIDATYRLRMAADDKHFYAIEANDDKRSDELKKIYIVDGKLIDLKAKCELDKVSYTSDGMVICTKDGDNRGDYPFADDGSLMKYPDDYRLGKERAYYADLNHYIVYNDDDEAVAIYADGKVVKSYKDVYSTRVIEGEDEDYYYIRTNRDDDEYTTAVVKTDGTEIFSFTGKYYYNISTASKDRIIAYDSGCYYSYCGEKRESGYYLFDYEGKKLYGPVYNLSRLNDDYYKYQTVSRYSSEKDPEYGLIDKEGKKVFSEENIYDFSISDQGVIAARKQTDNGSVYVVLDKEFKPIIEFAYDDARFYDNYFVHIKEDGGRDYYDINIKKIYSE